MRYAINRVGLCLVLTAAAACTESSPAGNTGSGGVMGGGSGGRVGTGGSVGNGGSGGTSGSGGDVSGGSGGEPMTTDASTDAPSGTDVKLTDASGGETSGNHSPMPSAGCGKANPNMKMRTIMTGGMTGTYYVNVPANYDVNKPMPLGFGFHGFGNNACMVGVSGGGECQGFQNLPAITVYMKSLSQGWEGQPQPLTENLQFYHDVLDVMKTQYCVDEARIFIAGVSSGGQFIEQIACRDGESLWQVTAVSAYVDNGANTGCKGTPPVLITQGATETSVSVATPVMFAKRNGCSANMPADYAKNKADMVTAFNMGKSDVRCMDWDACTLNPVRYCISSQMTYGGLTHGWPKIGGMLISDFQSMLK
ncbi:MAG: polyhydroxybutyrate depolymerase [Myxococcales bacterium]|jgi:hypothetical protein|nr:polyhydroxybutyrate depolymerase [Myxococcales bacterium]